MYTVCHGVNNSHIEDNVEVFNLYRDAVDYYHSIGGDTIKLCCKLTHNKGELIKKEAKLYNFERGTDHCSMLINLGLL